MKKFKSKLYLLFIFIIFTITMLSNIFGFLQTNTQSIDHNNILKYDHNNILKYKTALEPTFFINVPDQPDYMWVGTNGDGEIKWKHPDKKGGFILKDDIKEVPYGTWEVKLATVNGSREYARFRDWKTKSGLKNFYKKGVGGWFVQPYDRVNPDHSLVHGDNIVVYLKAKPGYTLIDKKGNRFSGNKRYKYKFLGFDSNSIEEKIKILKRVGYLSPEQEKKLREKELAHSQIVDAKNLPNVEEFKKWFNNKYLENFVGINNKPPIFPKNELFQITNNKIKLNTNTILKKDKFKYKVPLPFKYEIEGYYKQNGIGFLRQSIIPFNDLKPDDYITIKFTSKPRYYFDGGKDWNGNIIKKTEVISEKIKIPHEKQIPGFYNIQIKNPFENLSSQGVAGDAFFEFQKIDIPKYKADNQVNKQTHEQNAQLEIYVKKPSIKTNYFFYYGKDNKKITNLSNGDKIQVKFIFPLDRQKHIDDIIIDDPLITFSKDSVDNKCIVTFEKIISTKTIAFPKLPTSMISYGYDYYGVLEISEAFLQANNTNSKISKVILKKSDGIELDKTKTKKINYLKNNDIVNFTYKPADGFKFFDKQINEEVILEYKITNLTNVQITNPFKNKTIHGIETQGILEFDGAIIVPAETTLKLMLKKNNKDAEQVLNNRFKFTGLSNGDKIIAKFTAKDYYLLEDENGLKNKKELFFEIIANDLNNKIKIPDFPINLKAIGTRQHGELDITKIIYDINALKHLVSTEIIVSDSSGVKPQIILPSKDTVIKGLDNGYVIQFIYKPIAKTLQIETTNNPGVSLKRNIYINNLKGIIIPDNIAKNLSISGKNGEGKMYLSAMQPPINTTLIIKIDGKIITPTTDINGEYLEDLSNGQTIEFIYNANNTYILENPDSGTTTKTIKIKVANIDIPALNNEELSKKIKINGDNSNPNIIIDPKAIVTGTKIKFSTDNGVTWLSESDFITHIKKDTLYKRFNFSDTYVKYVFDQYNQQKIKYANNKQKSQIPNNNIQIQMMINDDMIKKITEKLKKFITLAPGSDSKNIQLIIDSEVTDLITNNNLKLLYSNDGYTWSKNPPTTFDPSNPVYKVKVNALNDRINFINVVSNIFDLDITNIPAIIVVDKDIINDIKAAEITGNIDVNNIASKWKIKKNNSFNFISNLQNIIIKYKYQTKNYDNLDELFRTAKLDKDKENFIKLIITPNNTNKQKYKIKDSINNELEVKISIKDMIQSIDITKLTPSNLTISTKDLNSEKANIFIKKDWGKNIKYAKYIHAGIITNGINTTNKISIHPSKIYKVLLKPKTGWILEQNNISMDRKEYSIEAKLEIDNPVITSIDVKFSKFNKKGMISEIILYKNNKQIISKNQKDLFDITASLFGDNHYINISSLNTLSNGDIINLKLQAKKGYTLKNSQNIFTSINVYGLLDEINVMNVKINNTKITFDGIDGQGEIVLGADVLINDILNPINNFDKLTIHFIVKDNNRIIFNSQLKDISGIFIPQYLKVGHKVSGYLVVKSKYQKQFSLINNQFDKNNIIDFGEVVDLKIHPSILGNDFSNLAFQKILDPSISVEFNNNQEEVTFILSTKDGSTFDVENEGHWHYKLWLKNLDTTGHTSTISRITTNLTTKFLQDKIICIGIKADDKYSLDNNYDFWSADFSSLKKVIDISKLGELSLEIKGKNASADVKAKIKNNNAENISFIAPSGTKLVYSKVNKGDKIKDQSSLDALCVTEWNDDAKDLNIVVGDFIVSKLISINKQTKLSNNYFTKDPVLATDLYIDFTKIIDPKPVFSGWNNHGIMYIKKFGKKTDPRQIKGIIWKAKINSKNAKKITRIKHLKNTDKVEIIPFAKTGYKLPSILQKYDVVIVSGLTNYITFTKNVELNISMSNINGISVKGASVDWDSGIPILNGRASLKDVDISFKDNNFKKYITINDIQNENINNIKMLDDNGKIINTLKVVIMYSVNNSIPSMDEPSNLKNGDLVKASISLDPNLDKELINKYKIANEKIGTRYKSYKSTLIVSGLTEEAPDLGKIKINIPKRNSGNGVIIIETENLIPAYFDWNYRTTSNGVQGKWLKFSPENLQNGDLIERKLVSTKGVLLTDDYFGQTTIAGLTYNVVASESINVLMRSLRENISFEGDNGTGSIKKDAKILIKKINNKLQEENPEDNNRVSLKLRKQDNDIIESIDINSYKLSNGDYIDAQITGLKGQMSLQTNYLMRVEGLRESDISINKTLMWSIVAGFLGVISLGSTIIIYNLLGKGWRKKYK